MKFYSSHTDRLLIKYQLGDLLDKVIVTDFQWEAKDRITKSKISEIIGVETDMVTNYSLIVKSLLFYLYDCNKFARDLITGISDSYSWYIQSMCYRREGEFSLARKFQDRVDQLGFYADLHKKVSLRYDLYARQPMWDPYLLIKEMEMYKFGERELEPQLKEILRLEWEIIFDTCWDKAQAEISEAIKKTDKTL
ncbi:MAG: hypothetical protein SGI98_06775 [Verrucomicrobiota bacterium]|nr:hypothetical protein [Verrucomicrobiota bacterium]